MAEPLIPADDAGPARARSRTDAIAADLTTAILRQRWVAGDRLPSERELAVRYDASRGVIREALERVQQLGLATVQPGGTRVVPVGDATLDVIGPLMALNDPPEPELVDSIMDVVHALGGVAVRGLVRHGSDGEIIEARARIAAIQDPDATPAQRMAARLQLGETIMRCSHNLPLRLIGNSLRMQFAAQRRDPPELPPAVLEPYAEQLGALDAALATRNADAAARAFAAIHELTHQAVRATLLLQRGEPAHAEGNVPS